MRRFVAVAICLTTLAFALPAFAHLSLEEPTSRYGGSVLKSAPCGMGDGPRSDNVATFAPGQTITVRWDEYINHPGHYRIAFDADGQDDFEDPACLSECDNRDMEIETYTNDAVLLDGIEDRNGGMYEVEVTLPNVQCDNCTLQVVQVMTDKPPYEIGGNDLYYQCADLILEGDLQPDMGTLDMGGGDMGADAGTPPDDAGTTGDDAGTANNQTGNNTTGGDDAGQQDGGTGGPDGGTIGDDFESDEGCCRVVASRRSNHAWMVGLFLLAFAWIRRR